jgi:glycolate oxidase FAD binding subunit
MHSNGSVPPHLIDGRALKTIHKPVNAEEVADLLRDADNLKQAIAPIGGGSKLSLGNVPDAIINGIDLTALNRIMHFEPADLTLSVEAGARFGDVQRTLAERGQTIPLDVPDADTATIGGLIATALAGPRRLGSGSLRDLLIGIAVAYPSGIVAKAGGLVVKNVTGFDLMRIHHGALGTLGVIVSANFKTVPLHRAETTVVAHYNEIDLAFAAADSIRASRVRPLALEIVRTPDGFDLAARIVGRPSTVDLLAGEAKALLAADSSSLANDSSAEWWRAYVEVQSLAQTNRVLIRCGSAPKESGRMVERVLTELKERALAADLFAISPGLGSIMIGLPAETLTAKSLAGLQSGLLNACAHVTILSAPADLKEGIDVWGRQPETLAVMRALKAEFDPNRIINPGRLVGRI